MDSRPQQKLSWEALEREVYPVDETGFDTAKLKLQDLLHPEKVPDEGALPEVVNEMMTNMQALRNYAISNPEKYAEAALALMEFNTDPFEHIPEDYQSDYQMSEDQKIKFTQHPFLTRLN